MTDASLHPLAAAYLDELHRAARGLPRARRDQLLDDIEGHLRESIPPGATVAEVQTALDHLGEPEQIVAAEDPGFIEPVPPNRGVLEWAAIVLLLIGGLIVPLAGWMVGVALLWISQAWNVRDKLIGTFVIPFGLLAPVALLLIGVSTSSSGSPCLIVSPATSGGQTSGQCTAASGHSAIPTVLMIAILAGSIALPIITAVYLARRARQPTLV